MWFQTVIYVILKDKNGRFILDENLSCLGMIPPRISCIQQCQCGSNIYTISQLPCVKIYVNVISQEYE